MFLGIKREAGHEYGKQVGGELLASIDGKVPIATQ